MKVQPENKVTQHFNYVINAIALQVRNPLGTPLGFCCTPRPGPPPAWWPFRCGPSRGGLRVTLVYWIGLSSAKKEHVSPPFHSHAELAPAALSNRTHVSQHWEHAPRRCPREGACAWPCLQVCCHCLAWPTRQRWAWPVSYTPGAWASGTPVTGWDFSIALTPETSCKWHSQCELRAHGALRWEEPVRTPQQRAGLPQ